MICSKQWVANSGFLISAIAIVTAGCGGLLETDKSSHHVRSHNAELAWSKKWPGQYSPNDFLTYRTSHSQHSYMPEVQGYYEAQPILVSDNVIVAGSDGKIHAL